MEIKPDHPDKETLDALGEIAFLAGRSRTHMAMPMVALRTWWEMPIALKQYWAFKIEGVPRLALSWAALSPEAERRYVVERKGLKPEDWRSGPQIWVIDWVAPFQIPKLNSHVRRWLVTDGFKTSKSVRFMRLNSDGKTRSILEIQRDDDGGIDRRILSVSQFDEEAAESTKS